VKAEAHKPAAGIPAARHQASTQSARGAGAVGSEPTSAAPGVPPHVPSGVASFFPAPALEGVPQKGAFALRVSEAARAGLTPGQRALMDRLDEIEALVMAGQSVKCVFDLDNTVFDTRYRTLQCARAFDAMMGTHFFKDLTVEGVHEDGGATASALGLPDNVVDEFEKFWQREFWLPHNLVHDVPIPAVVELVKACRERGADIVFLTGRAESYVDEATGHTEAFRADTQAQLEAAGIGVEDSALHLKPAVGEPTGPYKARLLNRLREDSVLGMFVTEGRRDTAAIQASVPDAHCFLLECKFEPPVEGPLACAGVPVLPPIF
jgi:hypothetical protein